MNPLLTTLLSPLHVRLACPQYISSAVSLALDLPRLQQLRQQLRPAMLQSTLCDGPTFGRQLETVYESLWTRYSNDSDEAASAAVSTAAQE